MAITKERKDELMARYLEWLEQSDVVFLAEYKGIPVKRLEELRGGVRQVEGVISITKNTLLEIALRDSGKAVPTDLLVGQMAAGFAMGEVPALAKALVDFAKTEDKFILKGGVLGNRILKPSDVEALASLPSLDQLRGQIIGLISAPARNVASTIAGGVRQLVNVLDAYAKLDENAEAAEAAA